MPQHTNAERKKRRIIPNLEAPALPLSVVPLRDIPDVPSRQVPARPIDQGPTEPPVSPDASGVLSEVGRGVESGRAALRGLGEGFVGAVRGAVGDEEGAQRQLVLAEAAQEEAARTAPTIERVQDVRLGEPGGFERASRFVAGIAGKQGVIFAPIIGAAAAGAIASPLLPIGATAAAATGAIGTGIGLETGDAFTNIVGDPESVENLGVQGASLLSLGTGAVSGSFEAVPALVGLKRIGLLKPFQRAVRASLLKRFTTGAASQSAIEAGTEAAQTIVQRTAAKFANENREILGDEGVDELINSAVAGAIFGGGVGAITGAVGGRISEPGTVEDQVDLEETLDELDSVGGRSTDIEDEIDRLGEAGQDIRDARLRPSQRLVSEDPVGVIQDTLRVVQEEGQLPSFQSMGRLLAAIRELENPDVQLVNILRDAGMDESIAATLIDRAGGQEIESAQDLATAPPESILEDGEVSQNFQELHSTRNFILRNANGKLGFIPSRVEGEANSLDRTVAALESDFPDIIFDKVGLGDAIVEDLDKEITGNPEELNRILNDVVAQKIVEPGFNAERFGEADPADPRSFLNQFSAIRRTQVDTSLTGVDELRLTDRDVFGGALKGTVTPSKTGVSVRQPVQKPLVADRKPKGQSDTVVLVPTKEVSVGENNKPVTKTVLKNRTLDAVRLTNLMLTRLGLEGPRTVDVVANAFFNGLAGLGGRGIVVDTSLFPSSLVVSKKGGKDITYGEITLKGAGRIRARITAFKAEEKRLQQDIQDNIRKLGTTEDPDVARRLRFINKKFKRRIKKIPSDIELMLQFKKNIGRDLRGLVGDLASAKELLAAEETELDSFRQLAVDIDNMVFNLQREGNTTLAAEQLGATAEEMQQIVDAAFVERSRRVKETAPEGAQAFEETPKSESLRFFEDNERAKVWKALAEKLKQSASTTDARAFGPEPRTRTQDKEIIALHKGFAKKLGLKTKIEVTVDGVKGHLTRMAEKGDTDALDVWRAMVGGHTDGVYDGVNDVILINPYMSDSQLLTEVLAHEFGHAIFRKRFGMNADQLTKEEIENSPELVALKGDFDDWLASHNLPNVDAAALFASKKPFFTAIKRLIEGDMRTIRDLSPEMQSYVLDFEEWFADQVSLFLAPTEATVVEQKEIAASIFKGIADDLITLFNAIIEKTRGFKPAQSVKELLDNIIHSESESITMIGRFQKLMKSKGLADDSAAIAGVMQALDPFGHATPLVLRKAFLQVLTEEERNTLFRFFSRASQKRRLKELAGTDAQRALIEESPLHAAVFGYQMWIGGEFDIKSTGRRILQDKAGITQEEVAGPVSQFVLDLFTKIFDSLSGIFGVIQADQQAEQILVAIRDGYIDMRKAGQKRWSVQTQLKDTMLQRIGGTFNTAFEHLKPFYERALAVADQRMLDSGIPGLLKIARGYHAAVGEENQPETFFEARTAKIGLFMSSYNRLTAELRANPDLKADVLAAMRNPKKASKDPDVQRIAAALFKFNRRFRNYLVSAGVEVGDRGPRYFPWVWNPRKVQDNTDFINGLLMDERFDKPVNAWLKRRNDEVDAFNVSKPKGVAERPRLIREELVDEIVIGLQQNEGYTDTELNPRQTGTTPWFASMHVRALGFLAEGNILTEAERERFDGLFSDQMDLTMMTYVRQGVKRAEYARRFGARSEKLQQFLDEARAEGASTENMRSAYLYIDSMNGVIGESTNQRLSKLLRLGARQGEVINPAYRTFTSLMIVIQNLAVLPLATLTSLVDPVGIMVRSQDMTATLASLRTGAREIAAEIRNLVGNDPDAQRSEIRKLAEGMGTIEDHMTNEALEWEYGSTYLTPRLKAANEFFFKAIGLTQWTRVTRIMALAGGKEFIKRHVQRPNKNSDRFLRQLNITAADVRFDKNGDLLILSRIQRETDGVLTEEELARDDRVRNALNRFVNESILRPNAAQRPIWASDPNYALIFHLKSFMFSFHDRILRRAFQEAALGNVAPLVLLTAFVPAMLFADILRDMIQFGLDGNPRKERWGLEDHIWNATQRSGLNGIGQLVIDAKSDIQFGGFGYESMVGPTVDGITDLDGLFSDDNEVQWKAFSRNLPGNSAWKHWIENGTDE